MSGHQYKALATDLYLEHQVIVSGRENSLNKYLLCTCQIDDNWSLKYEWDNFRSMYRKESGIMYILQDCTIEENSVKKIVKN